MGFLLVFINIWALNAGAGVVVKVTSVSGVPEAFSQVMIGSKPGVPFENNWVKTDQVGVAHFDNIESLEEPTSITIVSPDRPHVTYLKQTGKEFNLIVPSSKPQDISDLKGQITGWTNPGQNNHVDFGTVLPLVSASRIFELQVSDFMSTKMDKISVIGQSFFLPSNLSLPKQRLKYSFFPITLEKEGYLLPVPSPQKYHFTAITGRFPFEKVAKILMSNDKSFLDVVNDVKYEKEFLIYNQNITQATHNYDIDIKKASPLTPCISVITNKVPQDYKTLSVALVQDLTQEGLPYTITDLKMTDSTGLNLNCLDKDLKDITVASLGMSYKTTSKKVEFGKGFTIAVKRKIKRPTEKPLEFNTFFDIPKLNILNKGDTVVFSRVERKDISPNAAGFYAVLSEVLERRDAPNDDLIEYNIQKWVVFGAEPPQGLNAASFDLPVLPGEFFQQSFTPKRKKRWEVTWLGSESQESVNHINFNFFEAATHAARNSSDF